MVFQNVVKIINKWLLLKEPDETLKVLLATVIANKFIGHPPLWLFIIAPPSSAKSELIAALNYVEGIFPLSSLTPQTFISGQIGKRKEDSSLLFKLDNKILTFKDFTTVLSMHRDKRAEILSQLREIYDGQYKKSFGTGATIDWSGRVGFIAGVTPIIDTHYSIYTVLGERFIQYRMLQPTGFEMASLVMDTTNKTDIMKKELRETISNFINNIKIPETNTISIPEEIKTRIAHLASFCVIARSGIIRDYNREITYKPEPEAPPRLCKQFLSLAYGLATINESKQITMDDYKIILRIGMDNLHPVRRKIIELLKNNEYLELSKFVEIMRYPSNTLRRYLEDLAALDLVEQHKGKEGMSDRWSLTSDTATILEKVIPYPKCQ